MGECILEGSLEGVKKISWLVFSSEKKIAFKTSLKLNYYTLIIGFFWFA